MYYSDATEENVLIYLFVPVGAAIMGGKPTKIIEIEECLRRGKTPWPDPDTQALSASVFELQLQIQCKHDTIAGSLHITLGIPLI